MRVGIDAYLLHEGADYRAAGVSRYVNELLAHLPGVAPQHRYIAFRGPDSDSTAGIASVVSSLPTDNPIIRIAWEQTALPALSRFAGIDVLHGPVNVVPELHRGATVVTVHDLSFLTFPDRFPRAKAAYLTAMVARSCRKATRVIAVSASTRRDLLERLHVPASKVETVYAGVQAGFRLLPPAEVDRFRQARFGNRPYILHVGTLQPRKNIDILIRAFSGLRRRESLPHRLVLVGAKGWMYESLFRLVRELGVEEAVDFAGYVRPEDLPLWYNAADLLALPSAYEGFGLPLIEAMACGLPAVVSAGGALEEVGGSACLTVESGSAEALQAAMARILGDPELRASLREAGLERAKGFTWVSTAKQTANVYEEALAAS